MEMDVQTNTPATSDVTVPETEMLPALGKYTVECEKGFGRVIVAKVREVPGCITQATSMKGLVPRVREALSLFVPDAEGAELVVETPRPRVVEAPVPRAPAKPKKVREPGVAPQNRGFRAMDPKKQREIASKGGKASHAPGATGHEWDRAAAREAGRKGGLASRGGRGKIAQAAASSVVTKSVAEPVVESVDDALRGD